ncbi:MAG: restriction endonuclease [Sphingomonas sp.]|uniref:restriction endonuclease n=1 Tax=Sphingomonas sp. TaxID=28214 RepID=UPI0025F574ED|nr:restriction endonuclease [Sphingomonas sp.]MBX3566322.1 restriction endonuclease [Sphingomonas sp.]
MTPERQPGLDDAALEARIAALQSAIELWARQRDMWSDCGFQSFAERVGAEPGAWACVTVLHFEGPFYTMFNGTWDDGSQTSFDELVESLGFEYELNDHVSVHFYPLDPELRAAFGSYFHWRWVCSLIEPDCADVYEELYAHFARRPDDLHRIGWREFEILLFRIFQNQGFSAELGPGSGDGGVDIKLLQRDPLGDIMTYVQAKHYAGHRKIGLGPVQALYGLTRADEVQHGVMVTTSDYLPGARTFAARDNVQLALRTSDDVAQWCRTATAGIVEDKSTLISKAHLERVLGQIGSNRDPRILHAHTGYGITANAFALVLKETRHAALLMALPRSQISGDGQMGWERPITDGAALANLTGDMVWRARRSSERGAVSYWDGHSLYHMWDGQAANFNHAD